MQPAIDLIRRPAQFGADRLDAVSVAGLSPLEILGAIRAFAIFAWADRLMPDLG